MSVRTKAVHTKAKAPKRNEATSVLPVIKVSKQRRNKDQAKRLALLEALLEEEREKAEEEEEDAESPASPASEDDKEEDHGVSLNDVTSWWFTDGDVRESMPPVYAVKVVTKAGKVASVYTGAQEMIDNWGKFDKVKSGIAAFTKADILRQAADDRAEESE